MASKREDPERVRLGDLIGTPMRERGARGERLYWRVRMTHPRSTVWAGWATRAEVEAVIVAQLQKPRSSPSNLEAVRTVGELLNRFVLVQQERVTAGEIAPRSLVNYRQAARHWLAKVADVQVRALTRELVEDTLRSWRAAGVGARTVKLAADVMAAVVNWGAPRGLCPKVDLRRLASAVVDPEERVNCDRTPTRAEVIRVLPYIREQRDRIVVELLAQTGARIGEVAALRVGSWDRDRNELLISGRDRGRARRGKVRTRRWPVVGRLFDLLIELTEGRQQDAPLVVDLPLDCADLTRRALAHACAAGGVPRFTAHGLRRMVATELLDRTDPRTVAELTGHSVHVLLRDYIRPSASRLRDVVSRAHGETPTLRVVGAQPSGTTDENKA